MFSHTDLSFFFSYTQLKSQATSSGLAHLICLFFFLIHSRELHIIIFEKK